MTIAILYREELKELDYGPGHSFRGNRFEIFPKFLKQRLPENEHYKILPSELATDDDLLLICNQNYIDFVTGFYKAANLGLSYPGIFSNYLSGDNYPAGRPGKIEEAARIIVGQAKMACALAQTGIYQKIISLGGGMHHAKPNYGEGFCIYNDVAFVGKYLMKKYNLERILILDTDAHAGNGTSEYFYEERRVLFIDIHQDPYTLYPGTGFTDQIGSGAGKGFTINIPLPPGAGLESYRLAFEMVVEPLVNEFKPQIIIRNGGSDPHFQDGLTNLGLSLDGFKMIGGKVREMANICNGKVIDLIASGYNEKVLPYGWLALISGLAGFNLEIPEPEPVLQNYRPDISGKHTYQVIQELKDYLKDYWHSLR